MTLLSLSALLALLPAAVLPYRRGTRADALFWLLLAVAFAGPLSWVVAAFSPGWRTGLAPALWLTVVVTLGVFALVAAVDREGRRLSALLLPYLVLLGLAATVWQDQPERPMEGGAPATWVRLHIALSLVTYAALTVAAVAGVSAFLQDRALKRKSQDRLTGALPSLAAAESLELRLLWLGAILLGLGFVTGMTVQYFETGIPIAVNHKTMLSLATLAVVLALLVARRTSGLRGKAAARMVMLAYLLLTLAYPGVKFVTDVILA
jgi:ABC-type uncharacterized transport system permease subunit